MLKPLDGLLVATKPQQVLLRGLNMGKIFLFEKWADYEAIKKYLSQTGTVKLQACGCGIRCSLPVYDIVNLPKAYLRFRVMYIFYWFDFPLIGFISYINKWLLIGPAKNTQKNRLFRDFCILTHCQPERNKIYVELLEVIF